VASSPASTPRRTGKRAAARLPVASSPTRRGGAGSSLPPWSSWPRSAPRGRILVVPATAALSPLPPFSLTPQILAGAVGAVLLFFGLIAACCCCYCWGPAVSRASTSSRPRSTPSAASTTNTSLPSSAPTSTARAGARLRVRPQLHPLEREIDEGNLPLRRNRGDVGGDLGADAGEDLPPPSSSSRDLGHGSSLAHSRRQLANFHCVGPTPPPCNLLWRSLLPSGQIRLKRKATPK
jgi:hypothetical protein